MVVCKLSGASGPETMENPTGNPPPAQQGIVRVTEATPRRGPTPTGGSLLTVGAASVGGGASVAGAVALDAVMDSTWEADPTPGLVTVSVGVPALVSP